MTKKTNDFNQICSLQNTLTKVEPVNSTSMFDNEKFTIFRIPTELLLWSTNFKLAIFYANTLIRPAQITIKWHQILTFVLQNAMFLLLFNYINERIFQTNSNEKRNFSSILKKKKKYTFSKVTKFNDTRSHMVCPFTLYLSKFIKYTTIPLQKGDINRFNLFYTSFALFHGQKCLRNSSYFFSYFVLQFFLGFNDLIAMFRINHHHYFRSLWSVCFDWAFLEVEKGAREWKIPLQ